MKTKTLKKTLQAYVQAKFAKFPLKDRTRTNYDTYLNKVNAFLGSKGIFDIDIDQIDPYFTDELFLFARKKAGITSASRTVETCKMAFRWAKDRGLIDKDPMSSFEAIRDRTKEIVHLSRQELDVFINANLTNPAEIDARDCYVAQALTGMSYGDLQSYSIVSDETCDWLYNNRNKNNNEYWVPVCQDFKNLHIRRNGNLPKIALNAYNATIRILATRLGIRKYLTSHTARKTFATLKYESGWSVESIAAMMGINVGTLLKHYIKKTKVRLINEVRMRLNVKI